MVRVRVLGYRGLQQEASRPYEHRGTAGGPQAWQQDERNAKNAMERKNELAAKNNESKCLTGMMIS